MAQSTSGFNLNIPQRQAFAPLQLDPQRFVDGRTLVGQYDTDAIGKGMEAGAMAVSGLSRGLESLAGRIKEERLKKDNEAKLKEMEESGKYDIQQSITDKGTSFSASPKDPFSDKIKESQALRLELANKRDQYEMDQMQSPEAQEQKRKAFELENTKIQNEAMRLDNDRLKILNDQELLPAERETKLRELDLRQNELDLKSEDLKSQKGFGAQPPKLVETRLGDGRTAIQYQEAPGKWRTQFSEPGAQTLAEDPNLRIQPQKPLNEKLNAEAFKEFTSKQQNTRNADFSLDKLESLNERAVSGIYRAGGRLNPLNIADPDYQEFLKLQNDLAQSLRQPGTGAQSDKDFEVFLKRVPQITNTPEANKQIIDSMRSISKYNQERNEFINDWVINRGGSTAQAEQLWNQYDKDNPRTVREKAGKEEVVRFLQPQKDIYTWLKKEGAQDQKTDAPEQKPSSFDRDAAQRLLNDPNLSEDRRKKLKEKLKNANSQ